MADRSQLKFSLTQYEGKYKKTRHNCTMCKASYSYIKGRDSYQRCVSIQNTPKIILNYILDPFE